MCKQTNVAGANASAEPGAVPGWDLWPGWHDDCIKSSGIIVSERKPPPAVGDLPEEVQATIAEAMPLYEEMFASRLRVKDEAL